VVPVPLLLAVSLFYMSPHPPNGRPGAILDQAAASDRWKTGGGARRFIWQTTALMVRDRPVFGIGFGRYFEEHGYYQGKHYLLRGTPHDRPTVGLVPQVHNEYYQQMAETGIFGTFAMFWLVIVILTLWSRAYNRSSGIQRLQVLGSILGLAVLAIHALSSFPFRRPSTWLAGICLLAHIASVANQEGSGGKEDKKEGVSIPAFVRLVILVGLIFQMTAVVRPWIANVYVKKAVEGRLTPRGRLEYLNRAISWDPTMYAVHSVRALQLFSQGRFPDAIQAAQQAIHIREDLQMYKVISDSLLRMNRYEESARSWQGVLRLNPLYPPYLREAARRYRLAGDEETARHYERRAMQLETMP
jgi:tetratricopeptide (TPR) repeat protein